MTYTIGEKSYRNDPEETDLSSGDFYDMLRGGAMSTTSQINVETFREVAGKMARDGFDVLYVGFSSGLSGTFNSARIAFEDLSAEYPEHKFLAVDSLCASMGEGLLVYHAAQQQKAGRSIEETARWLEENKLHLAHWFTVDDLNHLKRGGRVWIRVFPDKPISSKPAEVRMGNGKGNPEYWVALVQPGRVLYEMDGVDENLAREAFALAAAKLPLKTKFVVRQIGM